ncbi:MAG: hypothetical protein ACKO24_14035, partial [Leptolyngbyaceae cyanobacterium]
MYYVNLALRTLNPMVVAGAIAAVGIGLPAFAETVPTGLQTAKQPVLLAQLTGQCRQVNRQIAVFTAANCNSGASRLLPQGARVTLNANQSTNGFIAIQGGGFVQTVNLTNCSTPTGNLCRRVIQTEGLIIRQNPDPDSRQMGFAPFNSQVTLTTDPPTGQTGPQNR